MARFTCPHCKNSFTKEAETAVCNGLSVKADEDGNPVDESGNLIPDGGRLVMTGTEHPAAIMKKGR